MKKTIAKELTKLSLCYPSSKQTNEEIVIMSGLWLESLVNVSPDVFVDACRLHREQSHWFPTLVEILDRVKDVWAARERNVKRLPEPVPDLSPKEVADNIQKVRDVVRKNKLIWEQKNEKGDY